MANEFKIKKGFISEGDGQITGSLEVSSEISASTFSGSFVGDGSGLTGVGGVELWTSESGYIQYSTSGSNNPYAVVKKTNATDETRLYGDGEVYLIKNSTQMAIQAGPSGYGRIEMLTAAADLRLYTAASGVDHIVIGGSTGNTGFNTTVTTGGKVTIKGDGNTASTTNLLLQSNNLTTLLEVKDDGEVTITGGVTGSSFTGSFVGDGSGLTGVGGGLTMGDSITNGTASKFLLEDSSNNLHESNNIAFTETGTPGQETVNITFQSYGIKTDTLSILNSAFPTTYYTKIGNSGKIEGSYNSQKWVIDPNGSNTVFKNTTAHPLIFGTNNNATSIYLNGSAPKVKIGAFENPTTATLEVKGAGATNATTAFLVENSSGTDLFEVKDDGTISGSIFSGSFVGDGSGLTGVSATAFPYEGDAVITGSLTISGSFNAFRVDSDDIVLGLNAGASLGAGTSRAVLIGENAGDSLTTSKYVVGIGYNAISTGTDGITGTIAIGYRAGQNGTTGDYNTLIGYNTGQTISTGGNNIALGRDAMSIGTVTGDFNTSLGSLSGRHLTSGNRNVFGGYLAGDNNTTGFRNIYLGISAGDSGVSGNYNIAIGDNADVSASGENQIAIGTGVITVNDGDIRIGSGAIIPFSGSSVTGDVVFPSTASAAYFVGDGSGLTGVGGGTTYFTETANSIALDTGSTTRDVLEINTGTANTYGASTFTVGTLVIGDGHTIGGAGNVRRSILAGNSIQAGTTGGFEYSIAVGILTMNGSYNAGFGNTHVIDGNNNFTAVSSNNLYGNKNAALGFTLNVGTSGTNVNESVVIGKGSSAYGSNQIVIGQDVATNATYANDKAIYFGLGGSRPSAGFFQDPLQTGGMNFVVGGDQAMRNDLGVVKNGSGKGLFYMSNWSGNRVSEPTVDMADAFGMWAKDRTLGVTGMIVKAENGGKSWIGDRIGANATTPSASLHAVGEGSTSATTTFLLEDSGSVNELFKITDDGTVSITGSIEMAYPSASGHQTHQVPGVYRIGFAHGSDNNFYVDNNIRLFWDAGGLDFEVEILTNPSAGEVHISYNNEGTYTYYDRQVSDGLVAIDTTFGTDETGIAILNAPDDSSYPSYRVTLTRGNGLAAYTNQMHAIVEKFL